MKTRYWLPLILFLVVAGYAWTYAPGLPEAITGALCSGGMVWLIAYGIIRALEKR